MVGGVIGYLIGHWLGNVIASGYQQVQGSGQNDVAIVLGLSLGVVGWMAGIGALSYPLAKVLGYELAPAPPERTWVRYFRMTEDHKVVGMQYVVGVLLFFFTGGLLAMLIRTELLSPTNHVFGPGTYIAIVSEHGTIMMMMASSAVAGTLGNWLIPLMIGARRMAYPRVEAFSFWIFMAGYLVIVSALFFGGFPTGWTGYAPLQTQASGGMDSYLVGFAVIGIGMILAGFNLAATIINYRAPGMTWSRLPIFVWAILATTALLTLATPTLVVACLCGILDRTAQTAFFVNEHGGSSFLWENLFWFFGHPEVYIMALPGFGIVMEILPVFTRKPLFAYKVAAAGNARCRPAVVLRLAAPPVPERDQPGHAAALHAHHRAHLHSDRLLVPRHAWHAVESQDQIRHADALLSRDAVQFPHRWSDRRLPLRRPGQRDASTAASSCCPTSTTRSWAASSSRCSGGSTTGSPRSPARRSTANCPSGTSGRSSSSSTCTFFPMFLIGILGQPRRVFEYATNLQTLNDISSISAYLLGASFFFFIINVVWSIYLTPHEAPPNPWNSLGLEWQTPTPVPWFNFEHIPVVLNDPYHYGEADAAPVADLGLAMSAVAPAGSVGPEELGDRGDDGDSDPRPPIL